MHDSADSPKYQRVSQKTDRPESNWDGAAELFSKCPHMFLQCLPFINHEFQCVYLQSDNQLSLNNIIVVDPKE